MKHRRSLEALRVAELFADGEASVQELEAARRVAKEAARQDQELVPQGLARMHGASLLQAAEAATSASEAAARLTWVPTRHDAIGQAGDAAWSATSAFCLTSFAAENRGFVNAYDWVERSPQEERAQAAFLRDIFSPFHPIVLDPAWLTPTVVALARAAYDERQLPSGELDRDRLLILADALEDAGADAELLEHLREPGPHVRGCWCLDLILGKS